MREGLIIGLWTSGVSDLLLMFIILVNKEPRRGKDIDFFEVKRDGPYGHLFVLALAVDGVNSGFDLKGIWSIVKVAIGNGELQFGNYGRATAVERVGAAGCAPLRVRPRGGEVGLEVKDHINAA